MNGDDYQLGLGALDRLDYQNIEDRIGRFFRREDRPFSDLGNKKDRRLRIELFQNDHGRRLLDCFTWNNCHGGRRAGRIVERDYGRPDHLAESAVILKHAWRDFGRPSIAFWPGHYARIDAVDLGALAAAVVVSAFFLAAVTAAAIRRAWPWRITIAAVVIVPVVPVVAIVPVVVVAVAMTAAAIVVAAVALSGLDRINHDNDRHEKRDEKREDQRPSFSIMNACAFLAISGCGRFQPITMPAINTVVYIHIFEPLVLV